MARADAETLIKKYGKGGVIKILPESEDMCKLFTYVDQSGRAGEDYNISVQVQREGGVTYNRDGAMFALNAAISALSKRATIGVAELAMRGNISYAEIEQSKRGGAIVDALEEKMANLGWSINFYRELQTLYGPGTASTATGSLGTINAIVSGADLSAPIVANITRATWNQQMWLNMSGHLVDIYAADLVTSIATGVTVSAPSDSTNRITLTKAGSAVLPVAGQVLMLSGSIAKTGYGIQSLLENTGTMHGISASTYPGVWKAVSHAVGGPLSIASLREAGTKLWRKGLTNGATVKVPGEAFTDLGNEVDANNTSEGDKASREVGVDRIKIRTPAGVFKVEPYAYMKQGIAMVFGNDAECIRTGSGEPRFDISGIIKGLELPVPDYAGHEYRVYGQSAPLIKKPAHCAILTGLLNTTDTSPS